MYGSSAATVLSFCRPQFCAPPLIATLRNCMHTLRSHSL
jgi:hypothetical protein